MKLEAAVKTEFILYDSSMFRKEKDSREVKAQISTGLLERDLPALISVGCLAYTTRLLFDLYTAYGF